MSEEIECSIIEDETTDLRQGDIFYYKDENNNDRYGIIITGDCDISQNKCNNIISFCSIFSVKYHMQTQILKKKVEKQLQTLKDQIISDLKKNNLIDTGDNSSFDNIVLLDEDGLNSFFGSVDIVESISEKLIERIRNYTLFNNKVSYDFSDYETLFFLVNNKEADLDSLKKNIAHEKLAEDLFFINEIPQIDIKGFIVYLRYINTLPKKAFYRSFNEEKKVFRIAHLNPPYIHSLTQHVGAMFSDIGLPTIYEKSREQNINYAVDEIGEKK